MSLRKTQRLFTWSAIDATGQLTQGECQNLNRQAVKQDLLATGKYPLSIKYTTTLHRRTYRTTQLAAVTRQLATLLNAGLPLVSCLAFLAEQQPSAPWRFLFHQLHQDISQGIPISSALDKHPHIFPRLYRQIIFTGEQSGKLEECSLQLATHMEQTQKLRQQVRKALRYPLFVLSVALAVTLLMLLFVLPEFATIYASFDTPLPVFTRFLLNLANFAAQWGLSGIALLFFILSGYFRYLHRHPRWSEIRQLGVLHLPLVKSLVRHTLLSRVFNILSITQSAGLPLLSGLSTAAESTEHIVFSDALKQIRQAVSQGEALPTAFARFAQFPSLVQQLIRIGEESGTLESMFEKLASTYEDQAYADTEKLTQSLEPILMLIIATIVGALVIGMYLPIFQLGSLLE